MHFWRLIYFGGCCKKGEIFIVLKTVILSFKAAFKATKKNCTFFFFKYKADDLSLYPPLWFNDIFSWLTRWTRSIKILSKNLSRNNTTTFWRTWNSASAWKSYLRFLIKKDSVKIIRYWVLNSACGNPMFQAYL